MMFAVYFDYFEIYGDRQSNNRGSIGDAGR
jgi:hypothetical protein